MTRRFTDVIRDELVRPTPTLMRLPAADPGEAAGRLEQRIAEEAGKVRESFTPDAFEWVRPGKVVRRDRPPGITITKESISLTPAADELLGRPTHAEIGLAPRAIAIRPVDASSARGYVMTRKRENGRVYGGGQIMARAVLRLLAECGWPTHQLIPARWDPESRMLVAVPPKGAGREGAA